MRRLVVLALTALSGAALALLILVLTGLLPAATRGEAQEQPDKVPPVVPRGDSPDYRWNVVAGEGRIVRINQYTGESFVMRPYLEGKRQYWEPVDEHIHVRARLIVMLLATHFTPEVVEPTKGPGGKQVLLLKDNYKDPGFGFRPGDMIESVGKWENFERPRDFLNALYENASDRGGVNVWILRGDKGQELRVWLPLAQLEP